MIAHRVLEHSIRKHASVPVEIVPMLGFTHPLPKDPANRPRTTFSYQRFLIPKLCGYQGRALYLDADMVVFSDIAELATMPFDGHTVLCTVPKRPQRMDEFNAPHLGDRSVAVLLLDCSRLDWDIDRIVADLDAGRYRYEDLMSSLCIVPPEQVGDLLPDAWNDQERYRPGETKLLHYTIEATQPWKNDDNPLRDIWMASFLETVAAGGITREDVEAAIASRYVKRSLDQALGNRSSGPARRGLARVLRRSGRT